MLRSSLMRSRYRSDMSCGPSPSSEDFLRQMRDISTMARKCGEARQSYVHCYTRMLGSSCSWPSYAFLIPWLMQVWLYLRTMFVYTTARRGRARSRLDSDITELSISSGKQFMSLERSVVCCYHIVSVHMQDRLPVSGPLQRSSRM